MFESFLCICVKISVENVLFSTELGGYWLLELYKTFGCALLMVSVLGTNCSVHLICSILKNESSNIMQCGGKVVTTTVALFLQKCWNQLMEKKKKKKHIFVYENTSFTRHMESMSEKGVGTGLHGKLPRPQWGFSFSIVRQIFCWLRQLLIVILVKGLNHVDCTC